jgi:hypothetical protein
VECRSDSDSFGNQFRGLLGSGALPDA